MLLGLGSQHFVDFFDRQPQVEGRKLDDQLASLDFGEIQDVVDDREQGFTGRADDLGVLALLGREAGVEQQAGHADDAVHGGADFVAHVGQKVRLRPRCSIGGSASTV